MIRLSRLTDYGIQLLAEFARRPELGFNARDLSISADIPEPTVRKLLKLLSRAGLLSSRRGSGGGYTLARSPDDISIEEIVTALEGPVAVTACNVPGGEACERQAACSLSANWQRVNDAIRGALTGLTLRQMVGPLPASWRPTPRENP